MLFLRIILQNQTRRIRMRWEFVEFFHFELVTLGSSIRSEMLNPPTRRKEVFGSFFHLISSTDFSSFSSTNKIKSRYGDVKKANWMPPRKLKEFSSTSLSLRLAFAIKSRSCLTKFRKKLKLHIHQVNNWAHAKQYENDAHIYALYVWLYPCRVKCWMRFHIVSEWFFNWFFALISLQCSKQQKTFQHTTKMREWKMVTDVMDIKLSLFTMLKSRKYFHFLVLSLRPYFVFSIFHSISKSCPCQVCGFICMKYFRKKGGATSTWWCWLWWWS